jgi:Protein of unknown function (DUF2934)
MKSPHRPRADIDGDAAEITEAAVLADISSDEPTIREQAIRERAYAIWEEEGRPEGRGLDHWLRAQGEVHTNTEQEASRTGSAK